MILLGIGGIMNDAASAILRDGFLVAAVEESKLARRGRAQGGQLPEESIAMCLELAGVRADEVDCVAVVAADSRCAGERAAPQSARAFSAEPDGADRPSPRARRLGLLCIAIRRG